MFARDFRQKAWAALRGKWGAAILTFVVWGLIMGAAGCTVVGAVLLAGPMTVGFAVVMLNLHRKDRIDINDLFSGFNNFGNALVLGVLTAVFTALWSLLFVVPGIIASYSYSMAPYILIDHPEMSGNEAIKASKELMRGNKWRLFCLDFSYIGWILLCCLTFGILTLWVSPSMYASRAAFYEEIRKA